MAATFQRGYFSGYPTIAESKNTGNLGVLLLISVPSRILGLAALLHRTNGLIPSMSRRGNCWDNAVAESFFSSLKKEHVKKKIYKNRSIAHAAIAEYIEAFFNPTRRHSHLGETNAALSWVVVPLTDCVPTTGTGAPNSPGL